jgi:hypothetical protein
MAGWVVWVVCRQAWKCSPRVRRGSAGWGSDASGACWRPSTTSGLGQNHTLHLEVLGGAIHESRVLTRHAHLAAPADFGELAVLLIIGNNLLASATICRKSGARGRA